MNRQERWVGNLRSEGLVLQASGLIVERIAVNPFAFFAGIRPNKNVIFGGLEGGRRKNEAGRGRAKDWIHWDTQDRAVLLRQVENQWRILEHFSSKRV